MSVIKNLKFSLDQFNLQIDQLEIPDQGVTAFWGESGSGKTTLFKILIGLYQPVDWSWNFKNESLEKRSLSERQLGVVFQNYELFPHMTAEENILIVLHARNSTENLKSKIAECEQYKIRLQLEKCWNTQASKLSGGEKQRVALLRAIISQPKLLLLDEPFSALDPHLRQEAREIVKQILLEQAVPVYMITHDLEDVRFLAQTQVVLNQGRVLSVKNLHN